jgi:hypothetical protein
VYDDKCSYTVDRWGYSRSATASGSSLAQVPTWPQFTLRAAGTSIGSEREGQRVETYTVHFSDGADAAKPLTCNLPEGNWRALAIGSRWRADAYVVTGELDCATLRPPDTR